ncbi:MFS transporter [Methanobrevibacter acididurans]|uniref:MFS transporter n=1 Tax=Methanobrevibacter acididurans TaxID=120963 RepID=UPI0038FC4A96
MNEISRTKKTIILIILFSGAFFASLSQSLLTSAIPSIMLEFNINASLAQWLTSAYILVIGIVCTFTAYLINRFNTRDLFISCMGIFLIGSVLSYFSPNFIILLLSRIFQAFGTGVLFTLMQVVLLYLYPKSEHGKALSYIGLIIGFAPSIGPTVSGLIVDYSGWRSIFLMLTIVTIIIIILAYFYLVNIGEKYCVKMDFPSAIIIGVSITLLMLGVTNITFNNLNIFYDIIPILSGLILFAYFAHRQLNLEIPLLNLKLFKNHRFLYTNIIIYIGFLSWMCGYTLLPLFLQSSLGDSATLAGLVMLPANILYALLNPSGGKFYDKFGGRTTSIIGVLILLIGSIPFMFFNKNVNLLIVTFFYILRLIGLVFLIMPLFAYALSEVKREDYTHGTSIINSNRQIIGALGTTIILAFVSLSSKSGYVSVKGINLAFTIQVILVLIALFISVFLLKGNNYKS